MLLRHWFYILWSSNVFHLVRGSIKIIRGRNSYVEADKGDSVILKCRTNEHWEYCTWKHVSQGKTCIFEWKYSSGLVEMQQCPSLSRRVNYEGDYYKHECNLKINTVQEEDFGQWVCVVEDYVLFGGRGDIVKGYVELNKREIPSSPEVFPSILTTTELSERLSWSDLATPPMRKPYSVETHDPVKSKESSSKNAYVAVGTIVGLMFVLFFISVGLLYVRRRQKNVREFEWLTAKKKAIPVTEVIPDDQYDMEQNNVDIDPSTQRITYIGSSESNLV